MQTIEKLVDLLNHYKALIKELPNNNKAKSF
jgi:hypothetical protein